MAAVASGTTEGQEREMQMRLSRSVVGGAFLAAMVAGPAAAQEDIDNPGRLLASNCYQCHGTNGRGVAGGFEGLEAGEVASELREMMRSTSYTGEEGIMKVHAQAYSSAEISLIADYLSNPGSSGTGGTGGGTTGGSGDDGGDEGSSNTTNDLKLEIENRRYGSVVSSPSGIDCSGRCSKDESTFSTDTVVILTAVPEPGRGFVGWQGACSGNALDCAVTMSREQEVKATFSRRTTVNPVGDTSVTNTYTDTSSETDQSAVTGETDTGASETGGGSDPVSSDTSGTENSGATEKLALNIKGSRYGSVISDPLGIDCSDRCDEVTASFPVGSTVVLTAVPEPGRRFRGWSGDCRGTHLTCTVTLSREREVKATFR